MEVRAGRVKASITNHFIDFAQVLEKYKTLQHFPCRKIEIKRIVTIFLKSN